LPITCSTDFIYETGLGIIALGFFGGGTTEAGFSLKDLFDWTAEFEKLE